MLHHKQGWLIAAVLGSVAVGSLSLTATAAPTVQPVHARFVLNGKQVGSGTVIVYNGAAYASVSSVKTLTGVSLQWDGATATLSSGAAQPHGSGTAYLDQLPRQPYYSNGSAVCWQYEEHGHASQLGGIYGSFPSTCSLPLSHSPAMTGQHYADNVAIMVAADGSKTANAHNTATLDYDLGGSYSSLSGTIGLVDNPFNRDAMELKIEGNGKLLKDIVIEPAAIPARFTVTVAGVQQLSLVVSNISGAAPGWNSVATTQVSPGALMIANPVLTR